MASFPLSARRRGGFTLIELLVVITIVGILAAIVVPVYSSVQNNGRKTQAISDERNLILACLNYKADYNKLPLTPNQQRDTQTNGSDAVYGGAPGSNSTYKGYVLINALRGIVPNPNDPAASQDVPTNSAQTAYFNAPFVKDDVHPRHGILRVAATSLPIGSLVDPWGAEYIVWLDANNDHSLNQATISVYPSHKQDAPPKIYGPEGSVQVGSLGTDGKLGLNEDIDGSDDIITTQ